MSTKGTISSEYFSCSIKCSWIYNIIQNLPKGKIKHIAWVDIRHQGIIASLIRSIEIKITSPADGICNEEISGSHNQKHGKECNNNKKNHARAFDIGFFIQQHGIPSFQTYLQFLNNYKHLCRIRFLVPNTKGYLNCFNIKASIISNIPNWN